MSLPPAESTDELVAAARKLEAQASAAGEDGTQGWELRAQAAALRVRAIGEKPYPIVVCERCYRVTGWTDGSGSCDACLRTARRRAAFADPHGDWVSLSDERPTAKRPPRIPLAARLLAVAGRDGQLDRAAAQAWRAHADPGETGPASPEDGYELEVAKRVEIEALDDSGLLVRFTTETHRFAGAAWLELEKTAIAPADLLVPAEFSAGLPIEQLAEAWGDYQAAVARFNSAAWEHQSASRDADAQARVDRDDALQQQQHVAELLKEETD